MTLDELRNRIDEIDENMVHLLNERATVALAIGARKAERGAGVRDTAREEQVVKRVRRLGNGPLSDDALADIYRAIMNACLAVQSASQEGTGQH